MSDLNIKVYDTISNIKKDWINNLVVQSKLGSFFHRYEWLKSIEDGIGLRPKHIVVLKDNNIIGFFPNFITKIKKTPFIRLTSTTPGFGGPIITSQEKEVLELMFKKISEICGKNIISHYIITLDFNYARYDQYLKKKGYQPNLGNCRFIVNLDKPWEDMKLNMPSSRRRMLNKAYKQDFEIKDEKIDDSSLKEFYERYRKVMERVGGHAYPFQFFIKLNKNINNRIKIFTAITNGKETGKLLYFLDREQSSLHYFFSAIEKSNFKYHPSELLHEYAIKWGIENNYKKYDFGSTGSDFNSGLFKFKEEFGGQVVPSLAWEKGYSRFGWNLLKLGTYTYNKLR